MVLPGGNQKDTRLHPFCHQAPLRLGLWEQRSIRCWRGWGSDVGWRGEGSGPMPPARDPERAAAGRLLVTAHERVADATTGRVFSQPDLQRRSSMGFSHVWVAPLATGRTRLGLGSALKGFRRHFTMISALGPVPVFPPASAALFRFGDRRGSSPPFIVRNEWLYKGFPERAGACRLGQTRGNAS